MPLQNGGELISPTKIEEDESYVEGDMELRDKLKRRFTEIDNKNKAVDTQKYLFANQLRQLKIDILRRIFDAMKELGVDPSNPESLNKFLQDLEKSDPDLFDLFSDAISSLTPEVGELVKPDIESEGLTARYREMEGRTTR